LSVEAVFHTLHVVLTVIVVLVENADLAQRVVLQEIVRINASLALVTRLPALGPGKVLRIVPFGGAAAEKELWHLLGVHVSLDRSIGRRSQRLENQQVLIAFHKLTGLLDRLGGAECVI